MNNHQSALWAGCLLVIALTSGCGGETARAPHNAAGAVPEASAAFPVSGRSEGSYQYPQFQRWRIVSINAAPLAQIPADLGGVPGILRGRSLYFDEGYLTMPSLNQPGDQIVPACFQIRERQLSARPVSMRQGTDDRPLLFNLAARGRMTMTWDSTFELTLERADLVPDEGYQRRQFAAHFNQRDEVRLANRNGAQCRLRKMPLPALQHRNLEFNAPDLGKAYVQHAGELDPATALPAANWSVGQRRDIDPTQPGNHIAGCHGREHVTRLRSGGMLETPSIIEHHLVTLLVGETAGAESCERVLQLRKIDPTAIFNLFEIPAGPAVVGTQPRLQLRLDQWLGEAVFRAQIGRLHFEFSDTDAQRVRVKLLDSPQLQSASPQPAAAPTAAAGSSGAPPQANSPTAETLPGHRKIHRWIDANGVVNYSDQNGP